MYVCLDHSRLIVVTSKLTSDSASDMGKKCEDDGVRCQCALGRTYEFLPKLWERVDQRHSPQHPIALLPFFTVESLSSSLSILAFDLPRPSVLNPNPSLLFSRLSSLCSAATLALTYST